MASRTCGSAACRCLPKSQTTLPQPQPQPQQRSTVLQPKPQQQSTLQQPQPQQRSRGPGWRSASISVVPPATSLCAAPSSAWTVTQVHKLCRFYINVGLSNHTAAYRRVPRQASIGTMWLSNRQSAGSVHRHLLPPPVQLAALRQPALLRAAQLLASGLRAHQLDDRRVVAPLVWPPDLSVTFAGA